MLDSHCHLADARFDADLDHVIERAHSVGVTDMMCIADTMEEGKKCLQIAQKHEHIYCTIGVHPHAASGFVADRDLPAMRTIAAEHKCVAIGEIGLDYHYMRSPKDVQQRVFESQLILAKELGVPAVVHCRDAVEDVWTIAQHVSPPMLVIHCCTERWEDVSRFVERGWFLSFTGIATYPKSDAIRRTIEKCPLDQLMIETDSPYLAPVPHRGKRNEPAFVVEVAKCIAHSKGVSTQEIDRVTTESAMRFFGLI